mmetsp:Transcript_31825/g.48097  ORF Transcript_31825/g.48097 Transcript_31825/m.48097 type:complete len:101 (+) Transcript_31825:487-789(+)
MRRDKIWFDVFGCGCAIIRRLADYFQLLINKQLQQMRKAFSGMLLTYSLLLEELASSGVIITLPLQISRLTIIYRKCFTIISSVFLKEYNVLLKSSSSTF